MINDKWIINSPLGKIHVALGFRNVLLAHIVKKAKGSICLDCSYFEEYFITVTIYSHKSQHFYLSLLIYMQTFIKGL